MSYDVHLVGPDDITLTSSEKVTEGGTQILGGTNECRLNITGNYWQVWKMIDWSPRDLHGTSGRLSQHNLARAWMKLGGAEERPPTPWSDYWAPTPGNCLVVVDRLLKWAKEHPTGRWSVEA